MKKIITTILGASLLAGSVYAAGNQGMSGMMNGMDHSKMDHKYMQKCEAFMKKQQLSHSSWTPPKNKLLEMYPASES